ncbi:transglutaminase domain-containing protein [Oceanirhabdus sp. W0125-5]|uniref:transglutaminase domain-containing protein n=1 Tax=Oceanirhabdus sp. W0125-5 TaxID=2999116 RepID=UPI0022F344C9|nr:transglutaminase domain-containing protein [Oceanirhabdus sp. W0125-5]WBW96717.1 transglutaminase domain-containing protein [Oceanirhabdus sp. W0125-5]
MKKSKSIVLACIFVLGLVGCGARDITNTSINKNTNQSVEQKENINQNNNEKDSKADVQVEIDLSKENNTILVKKEKDIYNSLLDTIKERSSIVNFDISEYENINEFSMDIYIDALYIIDNIKNALIYDHPELNVVERIETVCDKEKKQLNLKIYYYYFEKNSDIFMPKNNKEVATVLNKRILKMGDNAKIDLLGNKSKKYDVKYIPQDNTIINISKDGTVDTLKAGETEINISIISKEDNSKIYSGALRIKVLPEKTVEAANVMELREALAEKIGEDSVYIYMKNLDVDIIYEGLQSLVSPYVFFICNNDYTLVTIQYYEDSKDKAIGFVKELNDKADEIIREIITPNMTDIEKVKTVYDYIINNADYDMEYYSNDGKVDFDSRTAYGILLKDKGICGGFADSLNILLRKVGIESYSVSGNSGVEGHMWNVVKLNDKFGYFDVTFDNTYSTEQQISHKYFNITEEEISKDHEWYKERVNKFLRAIEEAK